MRFWQQSCKENPIPLYHSPSINSLVSSLCGWAKNASFVPLSQSSPSWKKRIWSPIRFASERLWVTIMMLYLLFRFWRSSSIFRVESRSREEQGSSRRRIFGSMQRARAMQSLCACPPERLRAERWSSPEFGNADSGGFVFYHRKGSDFSLPK